jgi:hypothetical protein
MFGHTCVCVCVCVQPLNKHVSLTYEIASHACFISFLPTFGNFYIKSSVWFHLSLSTQVLPTVVQRNRFTKQATAKHTADTGCVRLLAQPDCAASKTNEINCWIYLAATSYKNDELTTHLSVPRLRIGGTLSPLPRTSSWQGANTICPCRTSKPATLPTDLFQFTSRKNRFQCDLSLAT